MLKRIPLLLLLFTSTALSQSDPTSKFSWLWAQESLTPPRVASDCNTLRPPQKVGSQCYKISDSTTYVCTAITGETARATCTNWQAMGGATPAGSTGSLQTYATASTLGDSGIVAGTLGPRGASADASGDNTSDNKLYPTLKTSSGQPVAITRSGIGSTRTLPDRGIEPVIVFGFDDHNSDSGISLAQTYCDLYNIPCTVFPTRSSKDTYPTSAQAQAWTAAGNAIGQHGSHHGYTGYDTIDGNPGWRNSASPWGSLSYYATGTATCTATSTTCTVSGGGTWSDLYAVRTARPGQYFVIDWDNGGGSLTSTDRAHAFVITAVDPVGGTITLDRPFDGTTSSPARNYEIRATLGTGIAEIDYADAQWASVLGSNWQAQSMNDPGAWSPSDDIAQGAKVARWIPYATGLQNGMNYGEPTGGTAWGAAVNPIRVGMELSNCFLTAADARKNLDMIVRERLFWPWNVEEVVADASCTQNGSYIKESVWADILSYAATLRDAGKLRILTADEAGRYVRSIPQPQLGLQALRNSSATYLATGANAKGTSPSDVTYGYFPGWFPVDQAGGTASLQTGGATTTAWSGDGAGTFTATNAGSAASDGITQCVSLWPGVYTLTAEIDCSGVTNSPTGYAYLKLEAYDASGNSEQALTRALNPFWWYGLNQFANYFEYSTTLNSRGCSAAGILPLSAQFRVPQGFNEPVCLKLTTNQMTGNVKFRHLTLAQQVPRSNQSAHGAGMGLKDVRVSRAAANRSTGIHNAAFVDLWDPAKASYDTSGDATVDTATRADVPGMDQHARYYVAADGTEQTTTRVKITAKGVADDIASGRQVATTALAIGGSTIADTDDTNRLCIRRLTTCNAAGDGGGAIECLLYDMDCDGTEDAEDWCTYENAGTVTNDADC